MERHKSMKFIGVTGGIGAGKTAVLSYIKEHYLCEVYLADQVAHEVKKSGTECYERLIQLLGTDVCGADGEIDKQKMAAKIFADRELLYKVNDIIHPAVKQYLLEKLNQAREKKQAELFFVEAALLIETGYGNLTDEMWYVYADEKERATRLMRDRGYSLDKANQIMASQLSEEEFRRSCDFVIDNSHGLTDAYEQIDKKLEAFTWHK